MSQIDQALKENNKSHYGWIIVLTGPAVAGFTADITGTFSMAFWLCSLLTASAVVLTYFLRPPSSF